MDLYTKNGRLLQTSGNIVYSKSGKVISRIQGEKVFGTKGTYVGTIVNDRLVYRSTQSETISSALTAVNKVGTARANRVGSAIWGEELDIPN